jgi:hypothetical protein
MARVWKSTKEEKCKGEYKEWKIEVGEEVDYDELEKIWKEEILA